MINWSYLEVVALGRLILFPSDYISRQENETHGEWLEFHAMRGRHSFSLVCLIKTLGGGLEKVC